MSLINTDPSSAPAAGSPPAAGQQAPATSGSQSAPASSPAFDFRSVLPEDIRSAPTFEPYSKVKDKDELLTQLARGYHSSQGMIGKKGLLPPGENATPEERLNFRKEVGKVLGTPENPDGYQFTFPEGYTANEVELTQWKKNMHALGIPASDAQKMADSFFQQEMGKQKAEQDKLQGWENETKTRLGANLDRDLNHARYALRELDKDGRLGAVLEESGLGSHPEVVVMLSKIGSMLGERGPRGEGAAVQASSMAPDQAQAELQQFERVNREAIFNAAHPDHDHFIKRRAELFRSAYPPKQA
jgi:hypothetical protein